VAIEIPKRTYKGAIRTITLGVGDKAVTVGGETSLPFYLFEGERPNPPRIAMEIWDMEPEDWPEHALEPFKDVVNDPAAWAKKCVEDYGAEMICIQMISTDPNDKDVPADQAADTVLKVLDAINGVPLIVWGTASHEKDTEVLKLICEKTHGKNLAIGPVEEGDHKQIGGSIIAYEHTCISSSPIDINLAKQMNILLGNLGVSDDKILIDPTTGGLGYGIEYSYSVMERLMLAALTQEDERLQFPMINNMAKEVWKSKEAKLTPEEDPLMGDPKKRAIIIECVTAMLLLLAGSDILIMRHPESIKMTKEIINDFMAAN